MIETNNSTRKTRKQDPSFPLLHSHHQISILDPQPSSQLRSQPPTTSRFHSKLIFSHPEQCEVDKRKIEMRDCNSSWLSTRDSVLRTKSRWNTLNFVVLLLSGSFPWHSSTSSFRKWKGKRRKVSSLSLYQIWNPRW